MSASKGGSPPAALISWRRSEGPLSALRAFASYLCLTGAPLPSTAASSAAMSIFLIVIIAAKARLAVVAVGTRRQVEQPSWRDLPGEAPAVLAPAAGALAAAVAHDRVPVPVGLFLAFGDDHEAHGFVGFEVRPAVQTDEPSPEHGELDGQLAALPTAGKIARGGDSRAELRCRERSRHRTPPPCPLRRGRTTGMSPSRSSCLLPSALSLVAFEVQHPGRAVPVGEHREAFGPEGLAGRHLDRLRVLAPARHGRGRTLRAKAARSTPGSLAAWRTCSPGCRTP